MWRVEPSSLQIERWSYPLNYHRPMNVNVSHYSFQGVTAFQLERFAAFSFTTLHRSWLFRDIRVCERYMSVFDRRWPFYDQKRSWNGQERWMVWNVYAVHDERSESLQNRVHGTFKLQIRKINCIIFNCPKTMKGEGGCSQNSKSVRNSVTNLSWSEGTGRWRNKKKIVYF